MVSVQEATEIILQHQFTPRKEKIGLSVATGRILAESVKADRDFPPFHRAAMDGLAISFATFEKGQRAFPIERVQAAGEPAPPLTDLNKGIEIMTGAMLPQNTDTIIRYEDIDMSNGIATIGLPSLTPGENIHRQGQDAQQDEILLSPGIELTAAEIALLASVGKEKVEVFSFPKTAIISTGNELVGIGETPLPFQIRRSNSYAIQSALHAVGCPSNLFHLPDDRQVLERELKVIFKAHELVILSGGVSKGKFDYVPEVLESIGVRKKFHQVSQKPGKPFWFGSSEQHTVFALPGNPVSTYMCCYRYILPWLMKSMSAPPIVSTALLAEDFSFAPALTYFVQVQVRNESGKLMAYPAPGGGSGDFANLKNVDGFLELPAEPKAFKSGEAYPYFGFRN